LSQYPIALSGLRGERTFTRPARAGDSVKNPVALSGRFYFMREWSPFSLQKIKPNFKGQ
jgi:hypothetical protein